MRVLYFDLSSDSPLPLHSFGGFEGEHNETEVRLTLPERMLTQGAVYYVVLETAKQGETIFSAPLPLEEGSLTLLLPKQAMVAPKLSLYAAAYRKEGEALVRIAKSGKVILDIKNPETGNVVPYSHEGGAVPGLVVENSVSANNDNPVSSRGIYAALNDLSKKQIAGAEVVGNQLYLTLLSGERILAGEVVGPQGQQGEKGEVGPQGPVGPQGAVDYSLVANAIKGFESGKVICLKDVSPLEHEMMVQLLEYVPDCDKRLLTAEHARKIPSVGVHKVASIQVEDNGGLTDAVVIKFEDGEQWEELRINELAIVPYIQVGDVVYVEENNPEDPSYYGEVSMYKAKLVAASSDTATLTTLGKNLYDVQYLADNGVAQINNADIGEFTVKSGVGSVKMPIQAISNTSYYVSGYIKGITNGDSDGISVYYTDGTNTNIRGSIVANEYVKFEGITRSDKTVSYIIISGAGGVAVGTKFKQIQVEPGTAATEYEPYKVTTYAADENGNVAVPNINPTTTLIAENTQDGKTDSMTIEVSYQRDINKVIDRLEKALLS